MKVSLNWIREYLNFELPTVDEVVEKIGSQLGAIESIEDTGTKYRGIVIAKVVSCQKHPDADKLSLCKIDDGGKVKDVERSEDGLVQLVCGAPNVAEGQLVAWLPPGIIVPETIDEEPYALEARDIRGQKSNGMLASPKELALGDSHAGLLILDVGQPGDDFAKTFQLDDFILDIENKMFTHRPDCFGLLGVARELAGIFNQPFKSPDWYKTDPKLAGVEDKELKLDIQNELPELVPRFSAIALSNVKVGPSPVWLQVVLTKLGQKSINNVVDLTNYFMLMTGQPLHAYDYDKVQARSSGEGAVIVIRNPHSAEKLKLLNGKEIEPRPEAIMIATDKQLIGVGGVMGGAETEVDNSTNNIILECASFDMYSIRRTSMAHGLFTDAVTRFTKGQSPLQNLAVLAKIVSEIQTSTDAKIASPILDDNHLDQAVIARQSLHVPVEVTASFINERLGLQLPAEDIKKLLENVEFKVEAKADNLTVLGPFWRTDIELREDVVEEVGRLYGYDKLPLILPKRAIEPTKKDNILELKVEIRHRLSRAGANEVLTYSFVHGDLLNKVGQDSTKAFQLSNALSPDLQYYRLSLMPSLLDKVHANIKAGYDEFALFELGKTHDIDHVDNEGLPIEFEFTALVVAANDKLKKPGAAYYEARKYLNYLSGEELEFKPVSQDMSYPVTQPYDPNRSSLVSLKGGDFLGIIGEFKPSVTRALKLPKYCAGFEVDTSVVQAALDKLSRYSPLPRFPKVSQDITLKVPAELPYQELYDFILAEIADKRPDQTEFTLEPLDIYQEDAKHITFRLVIASHERTLTDAEVNKLLDTVAESAKAKAGAVRV